MAPYIYSKLNHEKGEMRLISLLPSTFHELIKIEIRQVSLPSIDENSFPSLDASQVQETLPDGWTVYQTFENRYIFENDSTQHTFWEHPDPEQEALLRGKAEDGGRPCQSPQVYEALSYTWGIDGNWKDV